MYERFVRAAKIDASNWRDPEHDLEAIRLANDEERLAIERFLIARGIQHYIDAEALALLGTDRAKEVLRDAFRSESPAIRAAVARVASELLLDHEKDEELVRRIAQCDAYQGLSLTIDQIIESPSSKAIDAMLIRIVRDPGVAAVNFAGLLLYLHGKADEPFDWDKRPFLLRFNAGDESDRRVAFQELCQQIGWTADNYLSHWPAGQ